MKMRLSVLLVILVCITASLFILRIAGFRIYNAHAELLVLFILLTTLTGVSIGLLMSLGKFKKWKGIVLLVMLVVSSLALTVEWYFQTAWRAPAGMPMYVYSVSPDGKSRVVLECTHVFRNYIISGYKIKFLIFKGDSEFRTDVNDWDGQIPKAWWIDNETVYFAITGDYIYFGEENVSQE